MRHEQIPFQIFSILKTMRPEQIPLDFYKSTVNAIAQEAQSGFQRISDPCARDVQTSSILKTVRPEQIPLDFLKNTANSIAQKALRWIPKDFGPLRSRRSKFLYFEEPSTQTNNKQKKTQNKIPAIYWAIVQKHDAIFGGL